jgi:hypothetical protein
LVFLLQHNQLEFTGQVTLPGEALEPPLSLSNRMNISPFVTMT